MTGSILVLGKSGQLGSALVAQLGARAHAADMGDVDFSRPDFIAMLERFTEGKTYQAVINAAAYTQVDKAEGVDRALAFRVNAAAVGELALWCAGRHLPLVHYSTDYVFDGSGDKPRDENAPTGPLNAYGQGKLEGEQMLAASGAPFLLFRTSWVYDAYGRNFLNTMLRLFSEKDSISVVGDQVGAPTYAPHLAAATITALDAAFAAPKFPSGIYHLAGAGETSWYGFAQAIFALARSRDSGQKSLIRCGHIHPISTADYPTPAKRPLNSRLDCSKAGNVLGVRLPDWETGLKECFDEKYASSAMPDSGSQNHSARPAG